MISRSTINKILISLVAIGWVFQAQSQDLELNQTIFRSQIDPQSSGQGFGEAVAASGQWAVIGAPFLEGNTGSAYLFQFNGSSWNFVKVLETPPDAFSRIGDDVAIQGDWIAVAMSRFVAVYHRNTGGPDNWGFHSTLGLENDANFSSRFIDNSVSIAGNTMAIGAPETNTDMNAVGSVLIYTLSGTSWAFSDQINVPAADLIEGAKFGARVDLDSSTLAIGSPSYNTDGLNASGKAWVYERSGQGGSFQRTGTLTSDMPNDNGNFGSEVAIGNGFIIVGSPGGAGDLTPVATNDGSIYTFEKSNGQWMMTNELVPSVPDFVNEFGQSVSVTGNLLWTASDDATYLFRRDGNASWTEIDRDDAPTFPAPSNIFNFGTSVAIITEGTRIHGLIGDSVAENSSDDRVGATFFYIFEDGLFSDRFED